MSDDKRRARRRSAGLRKHQQMENVMVEESFTLTSASDEKAGEGVYVSATTANSKRFYGMLVEQKALQEATSLWLQDQASSLELNRRIKLLKQQQQQQQQQQDETKEGPSTDKQSDDKASGDEEPSTKRPKLDTAPNSSTDTTKEKAKSDGAVTTSTQSVQKFRYVMEQGAKTPDGKPKEDPGYRVLVATYASIDEAAGGDSEMAKAIAKACGEGGNFLPGNTEYYYQYEVLPSGLSSQSSKGGASHDLRTSLGFHTFLHDTALPAWFPLSNTHNPPAKVLNMLNMKRDGSGSVTWEGSAEQVASANVASTARVLAGGTKLPMQPRNKKHYQIGVVGGGIAGLSCCQELIALLQRDGIDAHVTLMEARPRLGGRLHTDREFSNKVPLELGASWIHGIDDNPLAVLARSVGIGFITASEEVQMFGKDLQRADPELDERTGTLFDDLLDHAADECWSKPDNTTANTGTKTTAEKVVRWYSSVFAPNEQAIVNDANKTKKPKRTPAPPHRVSSDWSIDAGLGNAINKHKIKEVSKLSEIEHRMLLWNAKNIEYALGANVSDLSMKYWDADDRHAFEGDHVLLRQGFSSVVDHVSRSLQSLGRDKFEVLLDFPVGKIEYGRKSASNPYEKAKGSGLKKMVEISDTCCVTSEDGKQQKYFDFVVCACPLGVLKESVSAPPSAENVLKFEPPLPFSKVDAISNVGFGLLNKIYLEFPVPFWRQKGIFSDDSQCLFGNISGVHPHHYMFFDIGRCLKPGEEGPAILMSLISGEESVACEQLTDEQVVGQVLETLRAIFSEKNQVPDPVKFRFTRWGGDRFSRGSYTFLPPGATDQDFQLLQSPINVNGDSVLLDGSETMRLFFAGEHTTALHPSMAHGAMLSGMRAAKEVVSTLFFKQEDAKDVDRVIPVALFRHQNPTAPLACAFCHETGGRVRQGSLVAFKKGSRQVLVHNNCAEFSPEVEVIDFKWKNVIKAVNRGKGINCGICKKSGATIGCSGERCPRVFHYNCAEDTGWRFDRDGKVFYCDWHRKQAPEYRPHCVRISMNYYLTKNLSSTVKCHLCDEVDERDLGELLAFQYNTRQAVVHEKCIKYTTICDTSEIEDSRMGKEFKNVLRAIDHSRNCSLCSDPGASVVCTDTNCSATFHYECAVESGWNFSKKGKLFRCKEHRVHKADRNAADNSNKEKNSVSEEKSTPALSHNLLAQFGAKPAGTEEFKKVSSNPGNLDMGGTVAPQDSAVTAFVGDAEGDSDSEDSEVDLDFSNLETILDLSLSLPESVSGEETDLKLTRASTKEPWKFSFKVTELKGAYILLASITNNESDSNSGNEDESKDSFVLSLNGNQVGSEDLTTLRDILSNCMQDATEVEMKTIPKEFK
eukprot:Nitzschia sp. Nitz4//scaffold30_size153850//55898//60258//NITZ4_002771-RA/size153850-augustus-gene-0.70-mRNA-1//-1//CDS//3329547241//2583//frame0